MAYQNIGTPRFYINILEYLSSIGFTEINDVYRTNPSSIKSGGVLIETPVPEGIFGEKSFIAFLGHSGGELNLNHNYTTGISVNAEGSANSLSPENEGFSIASFDGQNVSGTIDTYTENDIGSVVVGNYYDMPHSPDLNLKLTTEYDGIKTTQTKGGATLSNALYTKPADWGNQGAWQLGTNASNFRSGRRSWDLSFSYFSDTDIMPINASQSHAAYSSNGYNVNSNPTDINTGSENGGTAGQFQSNILDGDDFFSQVINRTMGGHLPFIFQPDNANNNPDQFAICRFEMDSITYTQVANNTYNLKLKIREVW